MFFSYNGVSVFYKRHLGLGTPIILLHGWGGSNVSFFGAYEYLCSLNRDVIAVDFPGFGSSDLPPVEWGIDDYALCISELIFSLRIRKATIVGHSFGGRVALCLGHREFVERIVLVDSAGLKPRKSIAKEFKIWRYKQAKKAGRDVSEFGSVDYLALPQVMKHVFVRIVNTHLDETMERIACPTLIVWGKRDKETPLYMARRLKRGIKDSTLVLLNGGHYAYAEDNIRFNLILAEFTKGERQCILE
ncbi:MAG: alpha/beta hydrolase [Clostridia bacterium]|nr:alpha/beta hydrolase [Clostridia bacterium]